MTGRREKKMNAETVTSGTEGLNPATTIHGPQTRTVASKAKPCRFCPRHRLITTLPITMALALTIWRFPLF